MKHYTVEKIDYSRYQPAIQIAVSGGSRPRLTFIHKQTKQKFFFKTYSHGPREVWAETMASHIGELAGIPIQKVTIKTTPSSLEKVLLQHFPDKLPNPWTPIGTMARNVFIRGHEITYGSAIVGSANDPIKLVDIETSIRKRYYAPADILQAYANMIVFDAFIGNMDRHHQNWGICESKKHKQLVLSGAQQSNKTRYFAPLFDHGSSLMFELTDKDVDSFLSDSSRLERYVRKGKYTFLLDAQGNKNNVFSIINDEIAAKSEWGRRFKHSIARILRIDLLDVATRIVQMPNLSQLEYSQDRKRLLYKSLILRYNILNNIIQENTRP